MSALRYRLLDAALAHRAVPDALLRAGSRSGARARERREAHRGVAAQDERLTAARADELSGAELERDLAFFDAASQAQG